MPGQWHGMLPPCAFKQRVNSCPLTDSQVGKLRHLRESSPGLEMLYKPLVRSTSSFGPGPGHRPCRSQFVAKACRRHKEGILQQTSGPAGKAGHLVCSGNLGKACKGSSLASAHVLQSEPIFTLPHSGARQIIPVSPLFPMRACCEPRLAAQRLM